MARRTTSYTPSPRLRCCRRRHRRHRRRSPSQGQRSRGRSITASAWGGRATISLRCDQPRKRRMSRPPQPESLRLPIRAQVGVLFRQFDGLEVHDRPWEACEQACHTTLFHEDTTNKGPGVPGRLSASISYRGLRERTDRKGISLAWADRAGYVIRNEEISLQCLYGKDAAVRMATRTSANWPQARAPAEAADRAPCCHVRGRLIISKAPRLAATRSIASLKTPALGQSLADRPAAPATTTRLRIGHRI